MENLGAKFPFLRCYARSVVFNVGEIDPHREILCVVRCEGDYVTYQIEGRF